MSDATNAITEAFAALKSAIDNSIGEVAKSRDMSALMRVVGYADVVAKLEANWNEGNPPGDAKAPSSGRRGRPRKVREGLEGEAAGTVASASDAVEGATANGEFTPGEVSATQVEVDAPTATSGRRRDNA